MSLFPSNTFLLLWGVPFMTLGQGLSPRTASALLAVTAVAGLVTGPIVGVLVARHPLRRSWLILGTMVTVVVVWATILIPSTPRAPWVLVVLVVVLAASSNMASVGFDFVRTYVPRHGLSTATGIVNVGGTVSSLGAILLIGVALDIFNGRGEYGLDDFRLALGVVQGALWGVGLLGLLVARRATRRRMATRGILVPPMREVVARLLGDRRR
ncbi:MAG: MFS transporter [Georgenia sp.]